MNKPKSIDEAIARARSYGTPTYMMLADEVERLRDDLEGMTAAAESLDQDVQDLTR